MTNEIPPIRSFTVTHAKLKKLDACPEQRRKFKRLYPKGLRFRANYEAQTNLIRKLQQQGLSVDWALCRSDHFPISALVTHPDGITRRFRNGRLHSQYGKPSYLSATRAEWHANGQRIKTVIFYDLLSAEQLVMLGLP